MLDIGSQLEALGYRARLECREGERVSGAEVFWIMLLVLGLVVGLALLAVFFFANPITIDLPIVHISANDAARW